MPSRFIHVYYAIGLTFLLPLTDVLLLTGSYLEAVLQISPTPHHKHREGMTNNYEGCPKSNATLYFLGPNLLDKNNILRAAAFKCPTFMHIIARFPAR
jgi:hypothetical protein